MSKTENLIKYVERGYKGYNKGIPFGFPRFDTFTGGFHAGEQYLIGGETGIGKSKFARHIKYKIYENSILHKKQVLFVDFSIEENPEDGLGELFTKFAYRDYGKVFDKNYLYSRGEDTISKEDMELLDKFKGALERYERSNIFHTTDPTPTGIHDVLMDIAKDVGKFGSEGKHIGGCKDYTLTNKDLIVVPIIDTINLAENEPGQTDKQSIDRISKMCSMFRKTCGFSPIIVQQFNAEISSTDRGRYGIKTPLLRDFEDSKRTTKDATVILGLFDPARHEMNSIMGYDVKRLDGWIRTLHLLKNRGGASNVRVALQMKGAIGEFAELPRSDEMTAEEYDFYTKY